MKVRKLVSAMILLHIVHYVLIYKSLYVLKKFTETQLCMSKFEAYT